MHTSTMDLFLYFHYEYYYYRRLLDETKLLCFYFVAIHSIRQTR